MKKIESQKKSTTGGVRKSILSSRLLIWAIVWLLWYCAWLCGAFHSDDWNFATDFGRHIPGKINLDGLYQAFWYDYLIRNGRTADVWARAMYLFPEPIWRLGMATLTVLTLWCLWRFVYFAIPKKSWLRLPQQLSKLLEAAVACLFFTMFVGDFTLVGSNFIWPAAAIAYVGGILLFLPVAYPFIRALKQFSRAGQNMKPTVLQEYPWWKIAVCAGLAPVVCLHLEIWATVLFFLLCYALFTLRRQFPTKLILPSLMIIFGFFIQVLAPGHSVRAKNFNSGISSGSPAETMIGAANSAAAFWMYGWLPLLLFGLALWLSLRPAVVEKPWLNKLLSVTFGIWILTLGLSIYRIRTVFWLERQPHQGVRNPALNTYFSTASSALILLLSMLLMLLFGYGIFLLVQRYYWSVQLCFVLAVAVIPIPLIAGETVSRVYVDSYIFLYLAAYLMFTWAAIKRLHSGKTIVKGLAKILAVTTVVTAVVLVLLFQSWLVLGNLPKQAEEIRQGQRQELVYPKTIPGGRLLIWNRPLEKYHPVIRKFYNLPDNTPIVMK